MPADPVPHAHAPGAAPPAATALRRRATVTEHTVVRQYGTCMCAACGSTVSNVRVSYVRKHINLRPSRSRITQQRHSVAASTLTCCRGDLSAARTVAARLTLALALQASELVKQLVEPLCEGSGGPLRGLHLSHRLAALLRNLRPCLSRRPRHTHAYDTSIVDSREPHGDGGV